MRTQGIESIASGGAALPVSPASGARLLAAHAKRLLCAARQICGLPDYERYLAHRAAAHPGEPVLSRAQFVACAIDRKYGKSGPRCC